MERKSGDLTDKAGSVASSLCALHCAVCALAPGVLGLVGLGFLVSHKVEWILVLFAIVFGTGALVLAWRSHRSKTVTTCLALGMVALLVARGLEMGSGHHDHESLSSDPSESVAESHSEDHAGADEPVGHGEASELVSGSHHNDAPREAGHHDDAHHDDAHHDDEHGGVMHYAGAGVGVIGGMLLLFGHLLNIRTSRRHREECCD